MKAAIEAVEYYLPEQALTSAQLAEEYPDWSVRKIEEKTGIALRWIAAPGECASDLAVAAANKLFASGYARESIDFLLLCTQSPDYFLPTTACLVHERLGLRKDAGACDFNLGCSGFVYGLSLAKCLIEGNQARHVLLITADTYSKFLKPEDRGVRTIFGDAGAAVLVSATDRVDEPISSFAFGTDGSGAANLIVREGGCRSLSSRSGNESQDAQPAPPPRLTMNGPEIFDFALRVVAPCVERVLAAANRTKDDVDLYVFHQANEYMLKCLRRQLGIPEDRFFICLREFGNTVSSTIPIALKEAVRSGRLGGGRLALLVGFGVGYSWAGCLVRIGSPHPGSPATHG